jgi:diguanylate cyclase (GGDEF)-like protein
MAGKLTRSALLVLVIAAFVLVSIGGLIAWTSVRSDVDGMSQRALPALIAVTDINADYRELRTLLQEAAQEPDPALRAGFHDRLDGTQQHLLAALSALRGLGMASPALNEVTAAYVGAFERTREVAMGGAQDQAQAMVYSALIPAERNLQLYIDQVRAGVQSQQQAVNESLSIGGARLLGYSFLCMCLGLVLWTVLMPPVAALLPTGEDLFVSREIASLMHGVTGAVVSSSLIASVALLTLFFDHPSRLLLYCWWALSLGVLVARGICYLNWRVRRETCFDGATAIRRFGTGSLASAVVWAAFPFMFFAEATAVQRMAMAFVFTAMAGGGALILAPTRCVSLIYLTLLLVPQILLFGLAGSRLDITVAILSLGMLLMLAYSTLAARRTTTTALTLSRENKRLADESMARQEALEKLNLTLEDRVLERTIQLEREVEARESYAAQLRELALRDPLTGLLNRRALAEQMPDMLVRAGKSGAGVQILFIDLDRFKNINDVQGHYVGDQVLVELACRLRLTLPESALVARWGGDEFLVAVPGGVSLNYAGAIRSVVMEPIRVRDQEVRLDASIGISLFPSQGQEVDVLVRQADVAMYQVKLKGRSGSQVYDPAMGEEIRRQHELGQALREALANERMSMVFQPVVPESGRHALKMEALLRWSHPARGVISPAEFVPVAEEIGLIGKLGRWCLTLSCREAMRWGEGVVVAVNVSALQAMSGELLGDVAQALAETGLPPARLELELTESVFAHDFAAIARVFGALRDMGVRIAIDDFGTGYSSLSYLHRLPIDGIKIDRSFICDAEHSGEQMLHAIFGMARGLGFPVVAEGVETEQQRQMLRRMSVDYIQGTCHSAPLLPEDALRWVERYQIRASGIAV